MCIRLDRMIFVVEAKNDVVIVSVNEKNNNNKQVNSEVATEKIVNEITLPAVASSAEHQSGSTAAGGDVTLVRDKSPAIAATVKKNFA